MRFRNINYPFHFRSEIGQCQCRHNLYLSLLLEQILRECMKNGLSYCSYNYVASYIYDIEDCPAAHIDYNYLQRSHNHDN